MNPARPVRVLDAGVLFSAPVTHALKLNLQRLRTPAGEQVAAPGAGMLMFVRC